MTASSRLPALERIATAAAQLALQACQAPDGFSARAKQAQDFVSEIDERVEQLIREQLALAFPGEAVFGEEQGGELAECCWIIDPIDGTTNFLRGVPLWAVSIGYVAQGQPEAGVVALPALGLMVAAQRGHGLHVNGEPCQRQARFGEVKLASLGDSHPQAEDVMRAYRQMREAGWVVEIYRSTATAMALAAIGRLDGHVQPQVKTWDMAGALPLCLEAGLTVRHGPLLTAGDSHVAVGTADLMASLSGC